MQRTAIEWANYTWNPWIGCDPVSPGCDHCYAKDEAARMVRRLRGSIAKQGSTPGREAALARYSSVIRFDGDEPLGEWNGATALHSAKMAAPLSWGQPGRVFVDSMTDLFYGQPFNTVAAVYGIMALAGAPPSQLRVAA